MNLSRLERLSVTLAVAGFFLVGVVGHLIQFTYPYMLMMTPWLLLCCAVALLSVMTAENGRRALLAGAIFFVLTFAAEAFGVATGKLFGPYVYLEALGFRILGVPPVIGLNWVVICFAVYGFFEAKKMPFVLTLFLTALVCTGFDLFMEPVAVRLGYWQWLTDTVPLQNYLVWFGLAAIAVLLLKLIKFESKNRFPVRLVFIELGFFILLDLALAYGW